MRNMQRQSFLGPDSEATLTGATVGIIGLGGGGSHIVQQLAHIGIGGLVIVDPQKIEDTNLNRLVGGTLKDVRKKAKKADIAKRMVRGLLPGCRIRVINRPWQEALDELRRCDIIVGAIDSLICRDELERFCRANLIPYVDIGMDVNAIGALGFLIAGQVALSLPDGPCLHCFRILTQEGLAEEAKRYGDAGPRPQVIWPNGVLASTAVGLVVKLLTPWHKGGVRSVFLMYDGNAGTLKPSPQLQHLPPACNHHLPAGRGDALFDVREFAARPAATVKGRSWLDRLLNWRRNASARGGGPSIQ